MSLSGVIIVGPACFADAESLVERFEVVGVVLTTSLTFDTFCGVEADNQACIL